MTDEKHKPGRAAGPMPGEEITRAMKQIPHRIVVFSGKGGVGKTTVAVNLAYALARRGVHVGLLDADLTGPNVPQMAGVAESARSQDGRLIPHDKDGVRIVSLASMVPPGVPIIWRGPLRSKALDQLLGETSWGAIDVLIADLPPGTGDEVLTIVQRSLPQMALVVTTPQEVALLDARRAANMAKKMEVGKIEIVENMSGLVCPHCGEPIDLFGTGGGQREAQQLGVGFLGQIPIDPRVREGADAGRPIVLEAPDSPVAKAFEEIAQRVMDRLSAETSETP
jgi:ATP-binding protein involved in chromosome partitioning